MQFERKLDLKLILSILAAERVKTTRQTALIDALRSEGE